MRDKVKVAAVQMEPTIMQNKENLNRILSKIRIAANPPNTYAIKEKITCKEKVEGDSVNIPTPIAPVYASPSRIEKRLSL